MAFPPQGNDQNGKSQASSTAVKDAPYSLPSNAKEDGSPLLCLERRSNKLKDIFPAIEAASTRVTDDPASYVWIQE